MKTLGLTVALCALLGLTACGDKPSPTSETASNPIPLEGAAWDGPAMDPTQKSDRVRVIAFFKPG